MSSVWVGSGLIPNRSSNQSFRCSNFNTNVEPPPLVNQLNDLDYLDVRFRLKKNEKKERKKKDREMETDEEEGKER